MTDLVDESVMAELRVRAQQYCAFAGAVLIIENRVSYHLLNIQKNYGKHWKTTFVIGKST